MTYRINEGELPIPADWRDQTINVFKIPGSGSAREASFVISRDPDRGMKPFEDYIDSQIAQCKNSLPRFALKKNDRFEYQQHQGAWLEYSWQQNKMELYIRQVFYDRGAQILICTLTTTEEDLAAHDPVWRQVMAGMKLVELAPAAVADTPFPPAAPV